MSPYLAQGLVIELLIDFWCGWIRIVSEAYERKAFVICYFTVLRHIALFIMAGTWHTCLIHWSSFSTIVFLNTKLRLQVIMQYICQIKPANYCWRVNNENILSYICWRRRFVKFHSVNDQSTEAIWFKKHIYETCQQQKSLKQRKLNSLGAWLKSFIIIHF